MSKNKNSNSTLKESIADVQLLKQLAVENAKKAVIDSMSEIIQEELDDLLMGKGQQDQEEPAVEQPIATQPASPPAQTPSAPTDTPLPGPSSDLPIEPTVASPTEEVVPATPPAPATPTSSAPITPSGPVNVPLPDADGNIVINFEDLYQSGGEDSNPVVDAGASTGTNVPELPGGGGEVQPELPELTPEELSEAIQQFHAGLKISVLSEKFDKVVAEQFISDLVVLYEALMELKPKMKDNYKAIETRLEHYYETIQEFCNSDTTYRIDEGKKNMAIKKDQLNQFTKRLFREEASAGFGDSTEKPVAEPLDDKLKNSMDGESGKKAGKAAMTRSGKAGKSKVEDPGKEQSHEIKESVQGLDEAIDALFAEASSAGFGDGESVSGVPHDDSEPLKEEDEELEESCNEKTTKEQVARKLKKLNEEKKKLEKTLKEFQINVNIDLPDVPSGADVDVDTGEEDSLDDDMSFVDEGEPLEDEEEFDSTEDAGIPPSSDSADDEEIEIEDEPSETEEVPAEEPGEDEEEEEVVSKESLRRENKKLTTQLNEMEHLTARALYVSKLFADYGNLSRETKMKLTKKLDETATVAEAKEVYHKLNKLLENKVGKKPLTESKTRKVTSGGSTKVITESANVSDELSDFVPRFQKLAGIRK